MLGKQAKVLSEAQIKAVLAYLETTRNSKRDKVIFLLSLHGLRAKEISALEISMVTDAIGSVAESIALENKASKGKSGRIIPMSKALQSALRELLNTDDIHRTTYVICTERSERFHGNGIVVWFRKLYKSLGFAGASSHSGRRYFLTKCARNVSRVGGSIRDVMALAGHKHLATTQRYVEADSDVQKKLVSQVCEF